MFQCARHNSVRRTYSHRSPLTPTPDSLAPLLDIKAAQSNYNTVRPLSLPSRSPSARLPPFSLVPFTPSLLSYPMATGLMWYTMRHFPLPLVETQRAIPLTLPACLSCPSMLSCSAHVHSVWSTPDSLANPLRHNSSPPLYYSHVPLACAPPDQVHWVTVDNIADRKTMAGTCTNCA